ncbi:hypothetical protein BRARA_B03021 [Brassica rapa]|uniref:RNase H type-1 domain-containing protein n=1 Tax=Brassica campestris TaxID=3711 RepID=A0A398ADZ2_BRACM|nr:hypothetical protein BRARA_B03021 [Brassica rapa]
MVSINTRARAGWIIRDSFGSYQGACQVAHGILNDGLEAELQALLLAMQGDSQQLHDLVMDRKRSFRNCNWIREILVWRDRFEDWVFTWTSRDNNKVTDYLANTVTSIDDEMLAMIVLLQPLFENALGTSRAVGLDLAPKEKIGD